MNILNNFFGQLFEEGEQSFDLTKPIEFDDELIVRDDWNLDSYDLRIQEPQFELESDEGPKNKIKLFFHFSLKIKLENSFFLNSKWIFLISLFDSF